MRWLRIVGAVGLAGATGFGLFLFFAGTRLTLDNRSGATIHDVQVDYGCGLARFDSISDKALGKQALGKIGEGAAFTVHWRDGRGVEHHAHFGVYFAGLSGYNNIRIRFLPRGEIMLFDGDNQYTPDDASQAEHAVPRDARKDARA